MLTVLQHVNLAVRFVVEMVLLAAVGLWAWRSTDAVGVRLAASAGAPLAVATVWATVVHGEKVPVPVRVGAQVALFAAGAAAVAGLGRPGLAAALLVVVAVNAALMHIWDQ